MGVVLYVILRFPQRCNLTQMRSLMLGVPKSQPRTGTNPFRNSKDATKQAGDLLASAAGPLAHLEARQSLTWQETVRKIKAGMSEAWGLMDIGIYHGDIALLHDIFPKNNLKSSSSLVFRGLQHSVLAG